MGILVRPVKTGERRLRNSIAIHLFSGWRTAMQSITTTIQILLARYNGQGLIPLVSASESVGISAQTARNRLSNGTFPIPTRLVESRRFIHISDLAVFVDSLPTSKSASPEPEPVRKGRPPKLLRMKK
jgi:hypothetical protein